MAAVELFMEQERVLEKTAAPARVPHALSPWPRYGREEIMHTRTLMSARLWK